MTYAAARRNTRANLLREAALSLVLISMALGAAAWAFAAQLPAPAPLPDAPAAPFVEA